MKSWSGLSIGLSLVFGCLFLALLAEFYYLLCWKKKRVAHSDGGDGESTGPARELAGLFCWRKQASSLGPTALTSQEIRVSNRAADGGDGGGDLGPKQFGDEEEEEDSAEIELRRLHNLCGPPRILYTIMEETKEDLESEDEKSARSSRLSDDVVLTVDDGRSASPFEETPPPRPRPPSSSSSSSSSSPQLFFTPLECQHGLLESSSKIDDETARWFRASPPPKFKFLRDAEEKLYRKTLVEEALKTLVQRNAVKGEEPQACDAAAVPVSNPTLDTEERERMCFITINMGKAQEKKGSRLNPSQVTPLPASPPDVDGDISCYPFSKR